MTDKTDSKEREDFKRWAEGQPWIKDCAPAAHGRKETFGHWDTEKAWLAYQAGRAFLAANAGGAITPETGNSATAQGAAITSESGAASAGSEPVSFTAEHVTYINRYGGRCRDCADESGVCPNRGLPCEDAPKAIKFVLEALAYGINNGYINARVHPSPPEGMVGGWMPIETAPKSSTDGRNVDGIYLLGFCPEPDACNLQSYICIVWWEPNMKGGKGMWYGEGGYEVHPTHWMPLPPPPTTSAGSGKGD